jgi:amino acid adenylation domain-containing protein
MADTRPDGSGTVYLLNQLLSQSAERNPSKDAVVSAQLKLTYGELDSISDKLAGKLASLGVAKGDRVGIYVSKSLASIVSIFSILKAGAAYVPLDPNAPAQRLSYIIRDSGMQVLLTSREKGGSVATMFPSDSPLRAVVFVDADFPSGGPAKVSLSGGTKLVDWDEVLASRPAKHPEGMTEDDMAYILYTSGSTGTPKGVMLSHRNCLTFANWAGDCAGLTSHDRVSSHAPIHFDLSTFDIFSSVRGGATIVLVPEKASTFPVEVVKLIEREKLTVWYSVPSVLTMMLLYGNLKSHDLSTLRAVVFAGEVFPTKYLRGLMSALPGRRFLNWYGPTETNVCTWYEVPPLPEDMTAPIPIGRACGNTEVFSVDEEGNLVTTPGREGELYVRGPSVMLGYWGDRAKTDKVLIQNPFNDRHDEHVYRTGDIVTLDGSGNYLYVGRRDGMIKTRGYRVELGEVEAALYAHEGVKEAAVFPIPDEMVGNLIRAVVVPHDSTKLTREELLAYCSQRIPKYMIPDRIDFLRALPKTSTGKTDRVALAKEFAK